MSDKEFNCFIDSNIWLYAFINNSEEEHKLKIDNNIIAANNIIISTQVIQGYFILSGNVIMVV